MGGHLPPAVSRGTAARKIAPLPLPFPFGQGFASSPLNIGVGARYIGVWKHLERLMPNPKFAVVSLTEAAAARARALIEAAGKPVAGIKVGVKNGGCAGMTYTLDLAETASPGDEVIADQDVNILVAPKDLMFLLGTKLDFEADKFSSSFTFKNPNQTSACGCGESVSITPATGV